MSVKIKDVYVISDRGEDERTIWSRIGVAFVNKDDSLNVVLDCVPMSGRIHIRDRQPDQNKKKETPRETR